MEGGSDVTVTGGTEEEQKQDSSYSHIQRLVYSCPVDHTGTTVYVKGWRNPKSDKNPLIIVHDIGEEISLYKEAALELCDHGFTVYGFDLRGHGQSGRRLGHIPSTSALVNDLLQVVAWVKHKESGKKPIILGQGIGALVGILFSDKHMNLCKGCVFCSPTFELKSRVSKTKKLLIKTMAEVMPTMRLPKMARPKFSCPVKPGSKTLMPLLIDKEKLPQPAITANFASMLLDAIDQANSRFVGYKGNLLILHPSTDEICDYTRLKDTAIISEKENLKIREIKSGHYLLTESEETRKATLDEMVPWLEQICKVTEVAKEVEEDAPISKEELISSEIQSEQSQE